jgi:hypothetical protein
MGHPVVKLLILQTLVAGAVLVPSSKMVKRPQHTCPLTRMLHLVMVW